jgi:hypothetical protein
MNNSAENARNIEQAIESARQFMDNAISNLETAVELMENDYQYAGNPRLVSNAAGTLDLTMMALTNEVNRWAGYADARKHRA